MAAERAKSGEQQDAEAEVDDFRQHLGPFVVAAQTTRMPMVFTNAREASSPIVFANDSFLALTRCDRNDVMGRDLPSLMANGSEPDVIAKLEASLQANAETEAEIHYRRNDGSEFWASVFVSPVRNETGVVVQHFVSFFDLTRQMQETAHCRFLIDELNHRVRNTLATVQAIATKALRRSSDVEAVQRAIVPRLRALSRSHDLLSREAWKSAGLRDLVDAAIAPFRNVDDRADPFRIVGDDVRLSPKSALALGIAFHELATNALEFGALSVEAGSVRIGWEVRPTPDGGRLVLSWEEVNGPPVTTPSRKGYGSRILESGLAHELEGTVSLDYRTRGILCTIDIPAPRAPHDE